MSYDLSAVSLKQPLDAIDSVQQEIRHYLTSNQAHSLNSSNKLCYVFLEVNPLDYVYKSLGCHVELLDPNSEECQLILEYIHNSRKRYYGIWWWMHELVDSKHNRFKRVFPLVLIGFPLYKRYFFGWFRFV